VKESTIPYYVPSWCGLFATPVPGRRVFAAMLIYGWRLILVTPLRIISRLARLRSRNIEINQSENDQSWFWTDEWQAGEQEVDDYLSAGEYEEYDSFDSFIEALNDR